MSWEPRNPRPRDFCGRLPCPHCYAWAGGDRSQSLAQFAFELVGRVPTGPERAQAKKIADDLHKSGLPVSQEPEQPSDDSGATFVDIGMSAREVVNRMLKSLRAVPATPAPTRPLTLDEIEDRKAARAKEEADVAKKRDDRIREAREVAQVFADVQARMDQDKERRSRYEQDELVAAGVDPRFAEEMRARGMRAREIIYRWQRDYRPGVSDSDYMYNEPVLKRRL